MTIARTVRFHRVGGPEVLIIEDADIRPPGAEEVRIRTRALGINRAETIYREGAYVVSPRFPATIGYEAAGVVESIGPGVTGFAVGDAVSVLPVLPLTDYAVHGELVIASTRALIRHPANLSWEEAAAAWMQYITAYGALINIARLGPGDAVVISAASSSVGLAAIQLARRAGAVPIALTRSSSKTARLLEAGAAHVIATAEEDMVSRIRQITNGGARVTFDPVGGESFALLAEAAPPGGLMFIYGALAGSVVQLPIFPVLSKHLTVRGYDLFELASDLGRFESAIADISAGLADGSLKPVISRTFPFNNFADAHRYMESNQQFGKVVVRV